VDNFWALLKISFKTNLTSAQSLSTRKKTGSAAVLIVLVVMMTGYMFVLAYQMGKSFAENGMADLLILFAVIGGVFFTFINSIISSFHFIFKSKDMDILLAMPIKTSIIVSTKMLSVLALLYIYIAPVYIPFFTAYFIFAGVKFSMIVYAVLGFFLTPLFAFALGLLVGMLLNSLNSLRFAKPLYLIFMLAFIVFVMVISSNEFSFGQQQ
jgi:ABC-2 type transport system permease protein